jgi:hypothetical protein
MLGAAEVVVVFGFREPSTLALGLARAPAIGLGAEALVTAVTRIGTKQTFAVPALTTSLFDHHLSPPGKR